MIPVGQQGALGIDTPTNFRFKRTSFMAKKKAGKRESKTAEESDSPARPHILKLRLSPEEMQLLRVAAAIENKQPGVFARELVLKRSQKIMDQFRTGKK